MYCTMCGKQISDTANVCPFCGHKMMTLKELEAFQTNGSIQKPKRREFVIVRD